MSAGAAGPKVGVKLGVEKMPASPCAGSEVGWTWGAAVVSLVTVSLETDRADGNTVVSMVGGFGCLVCGLIGWVGGGREEGLDWGTAEGLGWGGGGCNWGRRGGKGG